MSEEFAFEEELYEFPGELTPETWEFATEAYPGEGELAMESELALELLGITTEEELGTDFPAQDFWAVWCPQEQAFVGSTWWSEYQAQTDAYNHNQNHSIQLGFSPPHTSRPYHVVFAQP